MSESWETIYTTRLPHRAELAKAFLAAEGINAVVVNKQNSAYPVFSRSEVRVPADWATEARQLLENETTFSEPE